jgi:hypothetical protein
MLRALVLALALGSSAAFMGAPVAHRAPKASTAMKMTYSQELGAQRLFGFWDPLTLVENADQEKFDRLRFTEIKHGRIAMLAVVGNLITAAGIRWGGYVDLAHTTKFTDIPGGLAAFSALPAGYLGWLIVALGGVDFHMARDYSGNPEFPGDIRNGLQHLPENCRSGGLQLWENYSAEEKLSKRAIELNNGRAAMMGILALMVHEKLGNLDLILPFGAPGNF